MEMPVLHKIAVDGDLLCGDLPFLLGGEARSGPPGIRVSLVIADVADRFIRVDGSLTRKSKQDVVPFVTRRLPVEGLFPLLFLYGRPAHGKPELRTLVSPIPDELHELTVGHEAVGQ